MVDGASDFLVSDQQSLIILLHTYRGNLNFVRKIKWLLCKSYYNGIYRFRGDGNCFYRAFGFAYIRSLSLSQDRASQLLTTQQLESTLALLVNNGMDEDIIRDFFEPFQSLVHRAAGFHDATSVLSQQGLLESFNDPETSNSIVMYLRLLTSTYLKVCIDEAKP